MSHLKCVRRCKSNHAERTFQAADQALYETDRKAADFMVQPDVIEDCLIADCRGD